MFKIHNLMANKELRDHVNFEGFDNIGFFDKETGKEERANGLQHSMYAAVVDDLILI